MKKYIPTILFILSIAVLIPGITLPLMTIKATVNKQEMLELASKVLVPANDQGSSFIQNMLQSVIQQLSVDGSVQVFESTRSLLETMSELIFHEHVIVGLLIGLFGIIIPTVKIMLTLFSLAINSQEDKQRLLKMSGLLSKWSMSDVFVMAILVAFLTVNANEQTLGAVQLNAELQSGFYFFSVYCLLAIAAGQLFERQVNS
ncbi:MAG: paraquat-inducible protein A [Methylococcaceae bacterium]